MFPSDSIWRVGVPPKVAFFAWETSWGKVLTLEQLQRRGFSLANRCFLCLSEVETVDHLLLHCVKAWVLWNLLLSFWCGLDSIMYSEGNSSWVAWSVCGESLKEDLANDPLMYILVSLEGKEFISFWE